jgi:hypothetical protein
LNGWRRSATNSTEAEIFTKIENVIMSHAPTASSDPFANIALAHANYTDKLLFGDMWKQPGGAAHVFQSNWHGMISASQSHEVAADTPAQRYEKDPRIFRRECCARGALSALS